MVLFLDVYLIFFIKLGWFSVWCIDNKNCNILLVNFSCLSLFLLINFGLKSILSFTTTTLAFYLGSFAWNIIIHFCFLRWCLSLMLPCISWMLLKDRLCFQILCLSVSFFWGGRGRRRPLKWKVINEKYLFILVILFF